MRDSLQDPPTVSYGIVIQGHHESLESALLRADHAMYRAKRGGRDRTEVEVID